MKGDGIIVKRRGLQTIPGMRICARSECRGRRDKREGGSHHPFIVGITCYHCGSPTYPVVRYR